jgi:hypothetical protein
LLKRKLVEIVRNVFALVAADAAEQQAQDGSGK